MPNFIIGTDGDDTLNGSAGNDFFQGHAGADRLDGLSGTDTASYFDSTTGVAVNLATGVGLGGTAQGDQLFNIEGLSGSAYNDVLTGNSGANRLFGSLGLDVLIGGEGADHLLGAEGNDILKGGGGADILDGGDGIDTADYSQAPSSAKRAESEFSLTESNVGLGSHDALGDHLVNIENITGSAFNDGLRGDAGVNVLI